MRSHEGGVQIPPEGVPMPVVMKELEELRKQVKFEESHEEETLECVFIQLPEDLEGGDTEQEVVYTIGEDGSLQKMSYVETDT